MATFDLSGRCGADREPARSRHDRGAICGHACETGGVIGLGHLPPAVRSSPVSIGFIFRCQYCDAQPDPLTNLRLRGAMREFVWGAYQNAMPGRWLIWHGRGLYGPARYACPDHRGDLVAYLRQHYGTIGFHPWKRPPYPNSLESDDTDHAWAIATRRGITGGF
jgi:hypothetical protein